MKKSIESVIIELGNLSLTELRERYEKLYQEPCYSKHKPHIIKRLVWKMQAPAENAALPPEAIEKAERLAVDAEVRLTAPSGYFNGSACSSTTVCDIAPPTMDPGNLIRRKYKGRDITVKITDSGFNL